jgi:hypothetical protein
VSKLNKTPRRPVDAETDLWYRQVAQQVNGLSEGLISALYQSAQSAPTTGQWTQGDFVTNTSPTELGTASSKYVIRGWVCVASGTPGTWVEARFLTGN